MQETDGAGPRVGKEARLDRFWPQLKRLLVFQLKLYVDAFRDFFLSLLSLLAFLLDVIQRNHGPDSHFENVLSLGRRTEQAINLFNQHDPEQQDVRSVDGVIREVGKRFRE
ncbi:MAG: hypothetical protein PsegKO_29570 [Pseudohongiellaceae bacterium]